ncbi:MAG: hypothetical protein ACJ789_05155 [Thermomicrobiales bacterium]
MHSHCSGTNRDGGPCNAEVRPGRAWCRWHDPELETQRAEWRRKGGAARSNKARAKKVLPAEPLTAEEVRSHLGVVFTGVIGGTMEPGVGTAAANIARALIAVSESHELEQRLQALEQRAGLSDRRIS